MKEQKPGLRQSLDKITPILGKVRPYLFICFLVFLGIIYGYLVLQINTLTSMEPTTTDISNQVKAANVPHIDEKVVQQLQDLKDNSVNVKTLFEEARNNPFQ